MTDFRRSPGAMRVALAESSSSTAPDPEYGPVDRRVSSRPQVLLIVDDQDDLRRMWRFWLGLWNFRVVEARDGLEALAYTQAQRPIAIVMDLWMPRLDGLAAVRRIKASRETADIPVIGVTAQGLHTQISHDFAEFCDVLLEKPVDPEELLLHIRNALRRRRHD
jgi:CheY-like chemotaxis protein